MCQEEVAGKIVILHSTTGKRTLEFHTTLEVNTLVKPLWFPPCFSFPLVYFIFAFMFKMKVRVDHRMQTADAGCPVPMGVQQPHNFSMGWLEAP